MHRIESLQRGSNSAQSGELRGGNLEQRLEQTMLCQQMAHGPQAPLRNIGTLIRIVINAEGMMPSELEGELLNGLLVGQVKGLLQEHQAQHCVKFFRRGSRLLRIVRSELLHRKLR